MSGEFEAAGAAVTAGLVAAEIEGRAGIRHGDGKCLNCNAAVDGRFCANCGQPTHVHRTLGHVFEEFLHGVLHFDTKGWRTLPMLIGRPGTLTHDYIHGRRARYISPLAMFLFTIFLMFFVFALVVPADYVRINDTNVEEMTDAQLDQRIEEMRRGEQGMRESAAKMRAEGSPGVVGMEEGAQSFVRARERAEREIERRRTGAPAIAQPGKVDDLTDVADDFVLIEGADELNARFRDKLRNPELLFYKVQQNAYKFSFLLVPISLPFVALLFLWKRGWTFYDHVVFTLYSLSFMSLLFIVAAMMTRGGEALEGPIALLVGLGVPIHMFFHLKGTYALGWWSALWRTFFLLISALICLVIFIVTMVFFGVLA